MPRTRSTTTTRKPRTRAPKAGTSFAGFDVDTEGLHAEEWAMAKEYDEHYPCEGEAHWVPLIVVQDSDDIAPRALDGEVVARYEQDYMNLPPIRVQRGTMRIIDGRHRFKAGSSGTNRRVIRVIEEDIADDDLAVEAFRANLHHGKPYTPEERVAGLKLLLGRPEFAALSDPLLARETGLSVNTVLAYRQRQRAQLPQIGGVEGTEDGAGEAPDRRVGKDGRVRDVSKIGSKTPKKSETVSGFDPGAQEWPEDIPSPKDGWEPWVIVLRDAYEFIMDTQPEAWFSSLTAEQQEEWHLKSPAMAEWFTVVSEMVEVEFEPGEE